MNILSCSLDEFKNYVDEFIKEDVLQPFMDAYCFYRKGVFDKEKMQYVCGAVCRTAEISNPIKELAESLSNEHFVQKLKVVK